MENTMKANQTPKAVAKAKKPTPKSRVETLPVSKRQAEDIKGGRHRFR